MRRCSARGGRARPDGGTRPHITAYQNVADRLHALISDADALSAAVDAEVAAKKTLDLTQAQMNRGHVNYLTLLSAEQSYQQALLTLVQAQATRFGDKAALFEALGGGWWNRKEVAEGRGSQGRADAASRS